MTRFWIVDVFTKDRYAGNQLAVVQDGGAYQTEIMQRIAREMNFSETTFMAAAPRDGAWPVRIFTPRQELPFAGHPTIGTAWVARHELGDEAVAGVCLDVPAGRIPVAFDDEGRPASSRAWRSAARPASRCEPNPRAMHGALGSEATRS